jgi:hypothetical protein
LPQHGATQERADVPVSWRQSLILHRLGITSDNHQGCYSSRNWLPVKARSAIGSAHIEFAIKTINGDPVDITDNGYKLSSWAWKRCLHNSGRFIGVLYGEQHHQTMHNISSEGHTPYGAPGSSPHWRGQLGSADA